MLSAKRVKALVSVISVVRQDQHRGVGKGKPREAIGYDTGDKGRRYHEPLLWRDNPSSWKKDGKRSNKLDKVMTDIFNKTTRALNITSD